MSLALQLAPWSEPLVLGRLEWAAVVLTHAIIFMIAWVRWVGLRRDDVANDDMERQER